MIPAIARTVSEHCPCVHCNHFECWRIIRMQARKSTAQTCYFVCFSAGFIDYWFLANDTQHICHPSLVNSFIYVSHYMCVACLYG